MDKETNVATHKCYECGKSFCQAANLRRHIRIHTGEKPYQCTQCNKKFGDRSSLTWHSLTHNSEKHFKCEICGKDFYLESHLHRHELTHSNLRLFVCGICGKSLRRLDSLKYHLKSHTTHRNYNSKTALIKHFRLHVSEIHHKSQKEDKDNEKSTSKEILHGVNSCDIETVENNRYRHEGKKRNNCAQHQYEKKYPIRNRNAEEDQNHENVTKIPNLIGQKVRDYLPPLITQCMTCNICQLTISSKEDSLLHICI